MTDDWPSHGAELSRKTAATLQKWMAAYDAGKISRREAYILVSALYDTTSGLIERDLMDLLSDIHADLRKSA